MCAELMNLAKSTLPTVLTTRIKKARAVRMMDSSCELWCDLFLFSWQVSDWQLTMLGMGRHSLWNMCRQWKTTTLKGLAASARGSGQKENSVHQTDSELVHPALNGFPSKRLHLRRLPYKSILRGEAPFVWTIWTTVYRLLVWPQHQLPNDQCRTISQQKSWCLFENL